MIRRMKSSGFIYRWKALLLGPVSFAPITKLERKREATE